MLALCKQFLWGGATQNATGENRAEQPRPAGLSSPRVQQTFSSSAMQMRPGAGPLGTESAPGGSEAIGNGKVGLDLFSKEAEKTGDLLLDHDTVPYGQVGKLWPSQLLTPQWLLFKMGHTSE